MSSELTSQKIFSFFFTSFHFTALPNKPHANNATYMDYMVQVVRRVSTLSHATNNSPPLQPWCVQRKKQDRKIAPLSLSTLSVPCMKFQRRARLLRADAHARKGVKQV